MKKLFTLLTVLVATCGLASATNYVCADMTHSSNPPTFTATFDTYTLLLEKQNGTTNPTFNTNYKDLRVYAKGTATLSTTGAAMTEVVFNISSAGLKRLTDITSSVGATVVNADNATVTWTGNATSVTFTVGEMADYGTDGNSKAGQFDFSSIDISTSSVAPAVPTPEITGTTPFVGSTLVSISCADETAVIYYTTSGADPSATTGTVYSAPFTITEGCTVKAVAFAQGAASTIASKTFVKQLSAENVRDLYVNIEENANFIFSAPLTVIGQTGKYLYAQDETGGLLLYGIAGQTYNMGDIIPAGWSATKSKYHGAFQAANISGLQPATANVELVATEIAADKVADHLHEYVVIKNANVWIANNHISTDDGSVTMYNRFNFEFPADAEGKKYDVYCIAAYYDAPQIYPMSLVEPTQTGINDVNVAGAKVYKTIENGQVVIVKDNVRYNTMGQIIK